MDSSGKVKQGLPLFGDSSASPAMTLGPNVEIVRQQRFEVGPRYTDLKFIGEGAYGKCQTAGRSLKPWSEPLTR